MSNHLIPNLLEYALSKDIEFMDSTLYKEQVYFKCPFCKESNDKYKLTIHREKSIFKCFICNKAGSALTFIELFEKKPAEIIMKELRSAAGMSEEEYIEQEKAKHPAERLSFSQLKLIGIRSRPNKSHVSADYKKLVLDQIWESWSELMNKSKKDALIHLMYSIRANQFSMGILGVEEISIKLGLDIVDEVLEAYSSGDHPPCWAKGAFEEVELLFELYSSSIMTKKENPVNAY